MPWLGIGRACSLAGDWVRNRGFGLILGLVLAGNVGAADRPAVRTGIEDNFPPMPFVDALADAVITPDLRSYAWLIGLTVILLIGFIAWQQKIIVERRAHEGEIARLNRVYATISRVNYALVQVKDRAKLLAEICRIIVETGGFKIAWMGWLDPDSRRLVPHAVAGDKHDYVPQVGISADADIPEGQGPSGICFRTGRTYVCNDFYTDPATPAWRARALKSGIRSSISLPIKLDGRVAGVLVVYADEKDFFGSQEVALLEETAADVSFALDVIAGEERRHRSEVMLSNILNSIPLAVFWKDRQCVYLGCNEVFARVAGLACSADIVGKSDFDLPWEKSQAEKYRADDQEVMQKCEATLHIVEQIQPAGGGQRWLETSKMPLLDAAGRVYGLLGVFEDITERKLMDEALQESRAQTLAVMNSTDDLIWSVDPHRFGVLTYNQAFGEYFLNSRGIQLHVGMTPEELVPPEYVPLWREMYTRTLRDGTFVTEYATVAKTRILLLSLNVIKRGNEVFGISVFGRDITRLKLVTKSLQESEARFRAISEHSLAGIYIVKEGRLSYVNPALAATFGYTQEELTGASPLVVIHPDDHALVSENIRRRIAGEVGSLHYTFRGRRKNGDTIDVEVMGSRMQLDGQPAVIGNILDITKRMRAETALRESEARFRMLIRNLNAGVVVHDASAHITYSNEKALQLLGLSRDQLLGRTSLDPSWDVIHDDGSPFPGDTHPAVVSLATRQPVRDVIMGVYNPVQRGRTWLLASAEPLPGEPLQVIAVFHDITRLRMTEARLHLQGQALEATANVVMITDTQGSIEWVNPAFTRSTGYTFEEAIGRNPRMLKSGLQSKAFYEELWRTIAGGRSWAGELINCRKDGAQYSVESTITPVRDRTGIITHYVAVQQDVSQRKLLEKQLFETQRLESIGLLASGIAHDLNNILAPIMLSIELLRVRYPGEQRSLDLIDQCARRGADIVRQVLTFSRGMDGQRMPLKISRLVKEMGHMMSETLPRNIELAYDASLPDDSVLVDPTQIHQVLLNLAVNARDAMPDGGRLAIMLRRETLAEGSPKLGAGARPGDYVVISVSDTGCGIPPEILTRIFDPFFTTKPRGQGTGLGLSTVHGIVRSHEGFIQVQSKPGVGTTFEVYIPAATTQETRPATQSAGPFVTGAGRLVLVADDEAMIREITGQILEKHGFTSLLAENGHEAVAAFRANQGRIKLVILDRMMPGMSGEEAARIIRQTAPDLPIILSTGLVTDGNFLGSTDDLKNAGITAVLHKPYDEAELVKFLGLHA